MNDDRERTKEAVRAHFAAMSSGDYSALERIYDPAGRNYAATPFEESVPVGGRPMGPADIRQTMEWLRQSMEDLNMEIEDLIAEGDQVVAWVRATGTPSGKGGPLPQAGVRTDVYHAHRFRLRDGRIVGHWAVRDDLRAMIQSGVVKPPRAPAS